jgi:hypothetical protein
VRRVRRRRGPHSKSITETLLPQQENLLDQVVGRRRVPQAAQALADGEALSLGRSRVRWLDAPHLPHAWECGYVFEERTGTLFCGDLFTQPGTRPRTLACMHGSAWTGDGRGMLVELADALSPAAAS